MATLGQDYVAADLPMGKSFDPLPAGWYTAAITQATVKDGGTVLLGCSSTPDGKSVHVGFLTVRRGDGQVGPQGCVQ